MIDMIDPKIYGLSKRDQIARLNDSHLILVINRKSRIIMNDGLRILEKINRIRSVEKDKVVSLKTDAPVCSKTENFLLENGIRIIKGG